MSDQPSEPPIIQTPSGQLPTHNFKFEGKNYTLYKREASKDAPWYFRLQRDGQVRQRSMETNIAANAETKAKAMIAAAKGEHWEEFLDKTALRKQCVITIGKIFQLYRAYPNRRPSTKTRELNIHALRDLIRVTHKGDPLTLPLTVITADLVWDWKQSILTNAAKETDDNRHRQLLRSANSRLIQARSLFTADLQAYYRRQGQLTLPKQIDLFLKEPKFPTDETGKTDYWPPGDTIIANTFKALEELTKPTDSPAIDAQNLNLYKAIWLTLGFGLRKSEIALAKNNWFQNLNGTLFVCGDELAKNQKFPRVRAQLGVWDKIGKYIEGKDPDAYVITGTDHERTDILFRTCSTWMQTLGWTTQKAIHEFRSYAGCKVAMGDGNGPVDIRAAQEFLRHANITTTENYYMRYIRTNLKEVTLQLPKPQPFVPKIVNG